MSDSSGIGDFEIGPMKEEDIPDVLIIANENGLAPWSATDYLEELKRQGSVSLTIRKILSRKIAGFMVMRLITNGNTSSGNSSIDLLNIAIDKKNKRTRLGTALLVEAIHLARQYAPAKIWLEVRCSNIAAITFYKYHGFEIIHRRKALYSAPPEDGWVMKLEISAPFVT